MGGLGAGMGGAEQEGGAVREAMQSSRWDGGVKWGGVLTPFLAPGVRPIWQRWDGNFHQSADPQIGGRGETAQGTPPPRGQQVSVGLGSQCPPLGAHLCQLLHHVCKDVQESDHGVP